VYTKVTILPVALLIILPCLSCINVLSENTFSTKGTYWHTVENITPDTTADTSEILLWVALPVNHRGQKAVVKAIYPESGEIIKDEINGNEIVFWHIRNISSIKEMIFYYDFEVTVDEVKTKVDPVKTEPYNKSSKEYIRYTRSEPWLEITPEIQAKAREIVKEVTNPYYQAKNLFNWVVDSLTYAIPETENRGAVKTLKRMKGDCGEFAGIFVAMCRSLGIPARWIIANWFTGEGHAWAEFLLPPYGWLPVDPAAAQLVESGLKGQLGEEQIIKFMESRGVQTRERDYFFGNLYPKRLIVQKGLNIELKSKEGITRTFRYFQPGGEKAYPPTIECKGLSKKVVHTGFFLFGEGCHDEEKARDIAYKNLAGSYYDAGLYERAERGYLKNLEDKPHDYMAMFELGQLYLEQKQYDKAIEMFKRCLLEKGGSIKKTIDTWAHILLGYCYDLKNIREEAVSHYEQAISIGTDYQGSLEEAKKRLKTPYKGEE
jgi:hypothetical protein